MQSQISPAGISRRHRAALEKLHREGGPTFDAGAASKILGLSHEEASRLLGYMARRGWLSRVRRGLYVAVPLDARRPGEWIADPWVVASGLFDPCYIGGWSACEHWGLTEQLFRTVLVVTAHPVRERELELQGVSFRVTVRSEANLFGTVVVWRGQSKVSVSDPSRTIVDILDEPRLGGGIRTCADVLHEYLSSEHRDDRLLIEYGDRLGNRTVFKRLGFILERAGELAPDLIAACLERRSAGLGTLDPSVAYKGRIVRRWGLRANVELRRAGDDW
jgi:predicted transcriptional regulator of viral defense system